MKILVFSDTHLSPRFEEKKFRFLESIIKKAEQVIINGDFWEGYTCSFEQFIASPWKHLFPLLRKKETVYLFGNHDKKEFINQKTLPFAIKQSNQYTLALKTVSLIIEHGNRLGPHFDDKWQIKKLPSMLAKTTEIIQRFIIRKLGKSGMKKLFAPLNTKIKNRIKKFHKKNSFYVTGHTHYGEIDLENNFLNSGMIKHGFGQYISIENEKIRLKEEWYDP